DKVSRFLSVDKCTGCGFPDGGEMALSVSSMCFSANTTDAFGPFSAACWTNHRLDSSLPNSNAAISVEKLIRGTPGFSVFNPRKYACSKMRSASWSRESDRRGGYSASQSACMTNDDSLMGRLQKNSLEIESGHKSNLDLSTVPSCGQSTHDFRGFTLLGDKQSKATVCRSIEFCGV